MKNLRQAKEATTPYIDEKSNKIINFMSRKYGETLDW